jgi:hypothetical protein
MRALKPFFVFFFKKRSSFSSSLTPMIKISTFVFSVLRHMAAAHMLLLLERRSTDLDKKHIIFLSLIHTGGERKESTDEDEIRGRFRG